MTATPPFRRLLRLLSPLLLGGTFACGGEETRSDIQPATESEGPAAVPDPGEPGLASASSSFQPMNGAAGAGLTGTLWVASAQPGGPDGISLIAQLDDVPPGQAYAWAVHRGDCSAPDQPILALGHGTEAVGGGADRSEEGGPLGEAPAAFEASTTGHVEETVWLPFDRTIDRATFRAETFSLRIHPWTGSTELTASVACAVIPTPDPRG